MKSKLAHLSLKNSGTKHIFLVLNFLLKLSTKPGVTVDLIAISP